VLLVQRKGVLFILLIVKLAPQADTGSNPVVLKIFYISYPFIQQDCQIYPQYTQLCSFIENTKLTNSCSLEWFI